MPDEAPQANAQEQDPKKRLPIKTILVILGVILLEAGTIVVVKKIGGTQTSNATPPIEETQQAVETEMSEVALCEKLTVDNWVGGRTRTVVTLEVVAKTPTEKEVDLTTLITDHSTQIKDRIRVLVGSAQPDQVKDPRLQVIKREIKTSVEQIIGEGFIAEVLIPTWQSYTQD